MKSPIIFISAIILYFLGISCDYERIKADQEITSRDFDISDYAGLRVSNAFHVYVTFSDTVENITIEANSNLHDVIEVFKNGSFVNIGLKKHINLRGDVTLNAYITTKYLSNVDISGATRLNFENDFETEHCTLELSGASSITGGVISEYLDLRASGASSIDLFGSIDQLEARLSGSSDLKDFDLIVNHLDMELSGASESYLTVKESIDYRGSGASTLFYKGDASILSLNVSGASKIDKRE